MMLNDRVDIEQLMTTGTGQRGEPVGAWNVRYGSVPAEVTVLTGRKLELARQLVATADYQVKIWYLPIDVNMRLHWTYKSNVPTKDLTLYIGHIDDQSGISMTLLCSTEVG